MSKVNYNHLFTQLHILQDEAPCHGKGCVGAQKCDYGIDGCYGDQCAIDTVINTAQELYNAGIRKAYEIHQALESR